MDLLEIFMYGLFFIVLYWTFVNELTSPYNQLEQFNCDARQKNNYRLKQQFPISIR
jgi:hypothetical protein